MNPIKNDKTAALDFLLNHTRDVIWSIDRDANLIFSNQAFDNFICQITGKLPQVGNSVYYTAFGETTLSFWRTHYNKALQGEQYTIELSDKRSPNQFSEVTFNPIYDNEKNVIGAGCTSRDISAYKLSEIALQDANEKIKLREERFSSIIQSSGDVIIVVGATGMREYVSPSSFKVMGYLPEELTNRPIIEYCHPDDLKILNDKYTHVIEHPEDETPFSIRFWHKQGYWMHLGVTGSNQFSNSAIKGIVASLHDITNLVEAEQKARENEVYFRSLTENYPNGTITVLDLSYIINYTAGEDFEILDVDPTSIVGGKYPECFGPTNKVFIEQKLGQISKGHSLTFEINHSGVQYYISGQPLSDNEGNINALILTAQNITQKKRVEDALRESEEKFRMVSEHSPVGIFQVAPNSYCTWMNGRLCEIFGIELKQGLGFNFIKYFHPDDVQRVTDTWFEYAGRKKAIPHITFRIITQDRSVKWVYTQAAPLFDNWGEVIAYVGTIEDVSEIKHYQDELLKSRNEQEKVLNSMPDGVFFIDVDWTVSYANESAFKILSYSKIDLLGWNIWERFAESKGTKIEKAFFEAQKNKKPFTTKQLYLKLNIWLEINVVPNKDGFLVYIKNITETIELESHLKRIYSMSSDVIGISNSAGYFVNLNPTLSKILGYSMDELMSIAFIDLVYPDDVKVTTDTFFALKSSNSRILNFYNRYKTKSGGYIWLSWNSVSDKESGLIYFIARDITAQKEEESHLRMLQSVVTNTKDAVLITDAEPIENPGPRVIYANQAFTETTGYTLEDIVGKTPRILQGPKTDKKLLIDLKKALKAWQPFNCDLINYRKDGSEFWVNLSILPVADNTGYFTHWVSVQSDITEKKEAELRLKAFASQQESLAMLGFAVVTTDNIETIYSTCVTTLRNTLSIEFVEIALLDKTTLNLREAFSLGLPNSNTKQMVFDKGSQIGHAIAIGKEVIASDYSDVTDFKPSKTLLNAGVNSGIAVPLQSNNGAYGAIGIYAQHKRLFTADEVNYIKAVANILSGAINRIEANEKVNFSERKYRMLFEENPLPLWIYDPQTLEYHDVNDAAVRQYGYSRKEFLAMKITDLRPEEDLPLTSSQVESRIRTTATNTWRHVKKSGELIYVEVSLNPISIFGKKLRLVLLNDVTRKRELEIEKEKYQEQLENTVQKRTAQLLDSNHELEAFNYTVSHDLRTPIRAIQMFVALIDQEGIASPTRKEYAENIKACTEEMSNLINDLLEFSRLRRLALNLNEVDMEALAIETANYLINLEDHKNIKIDIGKLKPVNGDKALLKSVWQNLISNALKYSRKSRIVNIIISSSHKDGMTKYCVTDNGIGFDMKYVDKLFKPFSRLHSSSEYKGTGAGLAIVERIVSRHGGIVFAESTPGTGSKFYFSLPDKTSNT